MVLGALGDPLGGFWKALDGHLGVFGWPVAAFLGFCIGKRESVKSVVL